MNAQDELKLAELDIVLRKVGHEPIPYLRPGVRRLDAFRCRGCGYIRRISGERVDGDGMPPCMVSVAVIGEAAA
jgi:hypothetical protein